MVGPVGEVEWVGSVGEVGWVGEVGEAREVGPVAEVCCVVRSRSETQGRASAGFRIRRAMILLRVPRALRCT